MRTEAENHRLIISHMHMVPMVASKFRGQRGIPFDEIEAEGRVGLVEAARDWTGLGQFSRFANMAIQNQIRDFIRAWDSPKEPEEILPGADPSSEFYEWQNWSDTDFIFAISEYWTQLSATPEELVIAFDSIKNAGSALRSAMIGLSRRDRHIMDARFFTSPPSSIETIARHHKISHARTVFLIDRILRNIRKVLDSREDATPSAVRG